MNAVIEYLTFGWYHLVRLFNNVADTATQITLSDVVVLYTYLRNTYFPGELLYVYSLLVLTLFAINVHVRLRRLEKLPSNVDFLKKKPRGKKKK